MAQKSFLYRVFSCKGQEIDHQEYFLKNKKKENMGRFYIIRFLMTRTSFPKTVLQDVCFKLQIGRRKKEKITQMCLTIYSHTMYI